MSVVLLAFVPSFQETAKDLWSVKDRSTSGLMQRFYEDLWQKKQGRAEALRNAQLEMLARNRASEHDALPSTWGAFVLSGKWR